jgi:prepilin-type N-terminal cleavage/methylation domain-containing protein
LKSSLNSTAIHARRGSLARSRLSLGFTLVEITVTLVLLALMAALVAPDLGTRIRRPRDEIAALIARSRDAAVARAQPLVLELESGGAWQLSTMNGQELRTGRLTGNRSGALELRLSPTGTCLARLADVTLWNALECKPAAEVRVP